MIEVSKYEWNQKLYFFEAPDSYDNPISSKMKTHLEGITDLSERLAYYNKNICSLSSLMMDSDAYFVYGDPKEYFKIFSGYHNAGYKSEDVEIYFEQRDKEVNRMVNVIGKAKTYENKLKILFNTLGYHPNGNPVIYANNYTLSLKGPLSDALTQLHLRNIKPVVNLNPNGEEETKIYNSFVFAAFDKKYRNDKGFSESYKGFDFEVEKARLNKYLSNQKKPMDVVRSIMVDIENHYKVLIDDEQKLQLPEEMQKELDKRLAYLGFLGSNVFLQMANKIIKTFENNEFATNTAEYLRYVQILEVIQFYEHLEELEKKYMADSEKENRIGFPPKITAPLIALFCQLVEHSNTIKKGYYESAESYCTKVCERFDLTYTANVRKNYKPSLELKQSDYHLKDVVKSLLPIIPEKERGLITQYINNQISISN